MDASFAEWLLRQFSGGKPMAELPYAEVERLCANAGSLLIGAAYATPNTFANRIPVQTYFAREAGLVSRRTADGFKASLADRKNAVIAWPWDHLATHVAWEATKANNTSEEALAAALTGVGGTYALRHRDQVDAVLGLWKQVAAGVHAGAEEPDLARMGREMLSAFEVVTGAPR